MHGVRFQQLDCHQSLFRSAGAYGNEQCAKRFNRVLRRKAGDEQSETGGMNHDVGLSETLGVKGTRRQPGPYLGITPGHADKTGLARRSG